MKALWHYIFFFSLLAGNANTLFGAVVEREERVVERYRLNPEDYFSRLPADVICIMFPALAPSPQDSSTSEQRYEILREGSRFALLNRRSRDIVNNPYFNRVLLNELALRTIQEAETHSRRRRWKNLIDSDKSFFSRVFQKDKEEAFPSGPSLDDLYFALTRFRSATKTVYRFCQSSVTSSYDYAYESFDPTQITYFCRWPKSVVDIFHLQSPKPILYLAAKVGLTNFAQALVENGLHISISVFLQSIKRNNIPLLKILLAHKERLVPNRRLKETQDIMNAALFTAAEEGHKDALMLLLEHGANPITTPTVVRLWATWDKTETSRAARQGKYYLSPLEIAIHNHHWECATELMKKSPLTAHLRTEEPKSAKPAEAV